MDGQQLILVGVGVILLGFTLVFAGTIWQSTAKSGDSKTSVSAGGVVFIGPIPLIFGSDKKTTIIVAGIALLLMLAYFVFMRR